VVSLQPPLSQHTAAAAAARGLSLEVHGLVSWPCPRAPRFAAPPFPDAPTVRPPACTAFWPMNRLRFAPIPCARAILGAVYRASLGLALPYPSCVFLLFL
jgi:hypothetical protein